MKSIKNKVVWITGASSGIGRSLAEIALKEGAYLVLSARNLEALQEIVSALKVAEIQYLILPFDLSKPFDAEDLTKKVVERFGRIDYLFNNGGISQRSLAHQTPLEVDRKVFEVNFFGNISLTKAVLNQMIQQNSGHIVVTSSVVGKFGFPLRTAYSASKHALHGYYETLRAENYHHNIKVTLLIPGRINTDISLNAITHDGSNHGQVDPGQATGMSSQKAAMIIWQKVLKNKKEIIVGKIDVVMVHIRRFFPSLFYYLARKIDPK